MRLWNRTKKNKSMGQATTELAICATLIIAVFASMLRYGLTMNFQQQSQMKAFRQALKYSRHKNREVTYTVVKDKRGVNPFNLFGVPGENRLTASAVVAWIKSDLNLLEFLGGADPDEVEDYYELNNDIKKLDPIKVKVTFEQNIIFPTEYDLDRWMPIMVLEPQYRKERDVDANIEREETHSGITTQRSYSVSRDIQTKLVMYDKEDMEKEILKSLGEEQSRRKKEKAKCQEIIGELIVDVLYYIGLTVCDLLDVPDAGSYEDWIAGIEQNLADFGWKKVALNIAGMLLWEWLGGIIIGDREVVDAKIIGGYRQYQTWQEQDTWEGSSSWQAPL